MPEKPTLFVCHGDDGGPRFHPCLFEATGTRKLPTLKLSDGTIISHSRAILAWVAEQSERREVPKQAA
jgi:glutathione S-transferase